MNYWPWWVGGLALATIPVVHWLWLRRMFAVSGRYSALVDSLRASAPDGEAMDDKEMAEALRLATVEAFGACGVEEPAEPSTEEAPSSAPRPQRTGAHLLFFLAVAAGSALSAWLAGAFNAGFPPDDASFHRIFGNGPVSTAAVLLGGGILVGFGTRMAGGCTSGHGLCGVSRLQKGSLAATAAFFGAGILLSLLLERLA